MDRYTKLPEKSQDDTGEKESVGNDAFGWGSETAILWKKFTPPSRPSEAEVSWYTEMIKKYIQKPLNELNVLILGSTTEFRRLFFDLEASVVVCDRSKDYYETITEVDRLTGAQDKEELDESYWHKINYSTEFDVIISDLAVGNVAPDDLEEFIEKMKKALKPGGIFCGKSLFYLENVNVDKLCADYNKGGEKQEDPYGFFMYGLSIESRRTDNSIDFKKIQDRINELYNAEKIDTKAYEILNEKGYSKDLSINFYAYPHDIFKKKMENKGLEQREFFKIPSIYSEYFPVWVYQKDKAEETEVATKVKYVKLLCRIITDPSIS